jgi:hypothetical protein
MADTNTTVHIGENSPEQVAYKMVRDVANIEGKELVAGYPKSTDRKWYLDTFAECLKAVRGFRKID